MKKLLTKSCLDGRYSSCDTYLHELDWNNWWLDFNTNDFNTNKTIKLHVRALNMDAGETWHRVYPKTPKGKKCERVSIRSGIPCWIFDKQ